MGRPSSFTQEIADIICARLAEGETIRKICRDENIPSWSSIWRWLQDNPEFRAQYAQAREAQAHAIAEQAVEDAELADDPAKGRLAFDARRWFAGKVAPKVYGDKHIHTGPDGSAPAVFKVVLEDLTDPQSEDTAATSAAGED